MFWKILGTHFGVGFANQNNNKNNTNNNDNKVFWAMNWYKAVASVGNTGSWP